jgi:outer membrane protein assembly factor BamD
MTPAAQPFTRLAARALVLFAVAACGSGEDQRSTLRQWDGRERSLQADPNLSEQTPEALYAAGIDALRREQYAQAITFFDAVEREHPYSTWATNAKLTGAYAEYMRNRYTEAIGQLDRFIQLHPAHRDIAYAYYLRALSYYEQINDVQRDQSGTRTALAALQDVANRFPGTPYARDARLKIDLARDHLAGQEMEIGRFYQNRSLHGAAVGRFRRVVDEYQTTNHTAEALHRLTESFLALGLVDEARRTASVLGANYPGSAWYQDSYALLVGGEGAPVQPGFWRRNFGSIF